MFECQRECEKVVEGKLYELSNAQKDREDIESDLMGGKKNWKICYTYREREKPYLLQRYLN